MSTSQRERWSTSSVLVFGAGTGLRPSELFGLEHRDIDRRLGVVHVRRACANGRLKQTKTRLGNRAVPLQAKALEALGQLAPSDTQSSSPTPDGGRIDFRNFGRRHWKPARKAAGIELLRDFCDLRVHTAATFALRAGVPVFAVSRFIGSSIAMIDQHYGHLAHDSRQHAASLLDALALERAVDVVLTSTRALRRQCPSALQALSDDLLAGACVTASVPQLLPPGRS